MLILIALSNSKCFLMYSICNCIENFW